GLDAKRDHAHPCAPKGEPSMIRLRAACISAALLLTSVAAPALAQNLIIKGGTIHTGVDGATPAEVVMVRDGRIAWVGAAASAPAADGLEVVDLKGATLFPGFTDGHAHLDGIGWREMTLNLEGAASVTEAMARLSAWAEA